MPDPTITINTAPVAVPTTTAPIPGWKTTEFWVTVAGLVAGAAGYLPPNAAAAMAGIYIAARAALKAAHAMGYAKDIPDLPLLAPGQVSTTVTTVTPTAVPSQGVTP